MMAVITNPLVMCPGCKKEKMSYSWSLLEIYECVSCHTVFRVTKNISYTTETLDEEGAIGVLW